VDTPCFQRSEQRGIKAKDFFNFFGEGADLCQGSNFSEGSEKNGVGVQ
jgi:hypothetical protein